MFKLCEIIAKSSAIAICLALCSTGEAIAVEILPLDPIDGNAIAPLETDPLAELTSVQQLSDVEPTDWAYEALSTLMERYGVIAGYPDLTFRGDRTLSRYEFAAALNSLTSRIEEIIAKTTSDLALQEDIETLQRLQTEFATELAIIGTKVDALESRVTQLEENAFSTTTKLSVLTFMQFSGVTAGGRDVFVEGTPITGTNFRLAYRDATTNQPVTDTVTNPPEITFATGQLINIITSFSGRDSLIIGLAHANDNAPPLTFHSANFEYSFGVHLVETNPVFPLDGDSVGLLEAFYQFPINDSLELVIGPRMRSDRFFDNNAYTNFANGAGLFNSAFSTLFLDISRFSGAIATWKISPQWQLRTSYRVNDDEASSGAFFDALGKFANLTLQLDYSPSNNATIRFGYDRAVVTAPAPGSGVPLRLTNLFRGAVDDGFGGELQDSFSHNFLLNFDWKLSDRFALFGRYSYSTYHLTPRSSSRSEGDVELQAFQLGMAFPDLWKEGALGVVDVVIPFNILSGRDFLISGNGDGGTEINISANYFFPVNDNIAIIPAFYGVFNANNFNRNPFIYGGVLRTQFVF